MSHWDDLAQRGCWFQEFRDEPSREHLECGFQEHRGEPLRVHRVYHFQEQHRGDLLRARHASRRPLWRPVDGIRRLRLWQPRPLCR